MSIPLAFVGLPVLMIVVFVAYSYLNSLDILRSVGFIYIMLGMLIGLSTGFFGFLQLDKTVGPNPYGWWWPASFVLTVLGGLFGVIVYGLINRRKKRRNM